MDASYWSLLTPPRPTSWERLQMGKDAPIILILDASVLINFLCIGRTDLLQHHPASIVITEHVPAEVTRA